MRDQIGVYYLHPKRKKPCVKEGESICFEHEVVNVYGDSFITDPSCKLCNYRFQLKDKIEIGLA